MTSRYRWIGRRHDHGILLPRKFALLSDTKAKLVVEARARSTIITYQIYVYPIITTMSLVSKLGFSYDEN